MKDIAEFLLSYEACIFSENTHVGTLSNLQAVVIYEQLH